MKRGANPFTARSENVSLLTKLANPATRALVVSPTFKAAQADAYELWTRIHPADEPLFSRPDNVIRLKSGANVLFRSAHDAEQQHMGPLAGTRFDYIEVLPDCDLGAMTLSFLRTRVRPGGEFHAAGT